MPVATDFVAEIKSIVRHPLASDAALLTVAQYAVTGLGFLETVTAARLLGPNAYGVAALVMAYPTLVLSFVGIKSVSVTMRYIAGFRATARHEELKGVCKLGYGLDFILSALAFTSVAVTAWWVAGSFYHLPKVGWVMVSYAAFLPFCSLSGTSWAVLSSWRKFRQLAVLEFFGRAVAVALVLSLLLAGFGVPGMVFGTGLAQALSSLALTVAAARAMRREGVGQWWRASLEGLGSVRKELIGLLGWNYLSVTFAGFMGQVPLMLLGRHRGPQEAGFYRLATTLVTAGSYLESSFGRVTYPILSARWAAGTWNTIRGQLRRWTARAGLPTGILLVITVPLAPFVVPLVFGSGYRSLVTGLQLMMTAAALSAIFFWLAPYYYASGQISLWAKAYGALTALVICAGWAALQHWGFLGVAAVVAVGRVLFTLALTIFAWRQAREEA